MLPQHSDAYSHGFPTNPGTLFPSITFKNIKTDYGASCDGTGTNDATAFASWLAYGVAQGATQVGLIIPIGSNCVNCRYVSDFTADNPGIQNAVIWAFGATCTTVDGDYIGSFSVFEDTTHSSLINTANLNDTSVTLVTPAESSRYAIGDWLLIGALELQGCCGFPPNFQFYQYVQVTNVNAGTGTISISPSINSDRFKSTYPSIQSDMGMPNNGPASIFRLHSAWNTNLQIFGLNGVISGGGGQTVMSGRSITCNYCTMNVRSFAVSTCLTCTLLNSVTGAQEVDKNIVNYSFINSIIVGNHNMLFQSPSPYNMTVTNSTITGTLNGWPLNSIFANSTINGGTNAGGPNGYGHVNNTTFINTPILSQQPLQHFVQRSWLTYNNDGTFSILKSDPNFDQTILWAVPSFKYAFSGVNGTLNSVPKTSFTITDVTDQGTSIKIWTDLPNTLPTPTCNSVACTTFQAYGGGVITQTNSGPADVTQYAAP